METPGPDDEGLCTTSPPPGPLASRPRGAAALQHAVRFSSRARGLFSHRRELLFLRLLLKAEAARLLTTGADFFQAEPCRAPSPCPPYHQAGPPHSHYQVNGDGHVASFTRTPLCQHTQRQPSCLLLGDFELGGRVRRAGSESLDSTSVWKGVRRDRTGLTSGLVCRSQQPWGGEGLGVEKKGSCVGPRVAWWWQKLLLLPQRQKWGLGNTVAGGKAWTPLDLRPGSWAQGRS